MTVRWAPISVCREEICPQQHIRNLAFQCANKDTKNAEGKKKKKQRKRKRKMSGSSRVFLGVPTLASSQLRFNSFRTITITSTPSSRVFGMASEASSSANGDGVSASSAIDFLTLCHRLKVLYSTFSRFVVFFPSLWIRLWVVFFNCKC